MNIESTGLYQELKRRADETPAGPARLLDEFERMRAVLQEHGKYIVLTFPEYTPHDHTRHLDHLFALADRILGTDFYGGLKPSEIAVLAFGLFAHDWGMAVSQAERKVLENGDDSSDFALLAGEPSRARDFIAEQISDGVPKETAWRDYLRRTHGLRSGARLRSYLEPVGTVFADAVGKVAEGHTLDIREVRNYPLALPLFGESVNLAAIAAYIRIIDLLDVGEDRTPYALWKFVSPADPVSKLEWEKHRALSPVAIKQASALREVLIGGRTEHSDVFAALADLKSWVDEQFSMSIAQLRTISGNHDLDLDSRINWNIEAVGFEPLAIRFELQRPEILSLLSKELYEDDPMAFVRELLQNSVDAIDMREAFLEAQGLKLEGEITIRVQAEGSPLALDWTDNGIGMDIETLRSYFAKLGLSWYRTRQAKRLSHIEPISQFGVGILSCFAVSEQLAIRTRRDPQSMSLGTGLDVEIPTRESHFRIRKTSGLSVGTTIHLQIKSLLLSEISSATISDAVASIGRFVRHKIRIFVNEEVLNLQSLETGNSDDIQKTLTGGMVVGMRGTSAEVLTKVTRSAAFEVGSQSGKYHGYYSAMIPKNPKSAHLTSNYRVWQLEGEKIDFENLLINTEQALFVKGIQTGAVRSREGFGRSYVSLARHTDWVPPTVLLNLHHPDYVQFNLSRSVANLRSAEWLTEMSREIANKLRETTFSSLSDSPTDTAVMLGSCATFGGVQDEGLDELVRDAEIPVLVLRSGEGLIWLRLADFAPLEEFVEAPFDLTYANRAELKGFGKQSGMQGWEGTPALFPTERYFSRAYPWVDPTLSFSFRSLVRLGWHPHRIVLVKAPRKETIPLVCRVWRRGSEGPFTKSSDLRWRILKLLYGNSPEVLEFPEALSNYAAFGSRFWNRQHPKISRIVEILSKLGDLRRQNHLSAEHSKLVSYLSGTDFQGHVVPCRYSGINLALDVPNRLLAVARNAGLTDAPNLVPADFFPGTIDGYQNPYHYDLHDWKASKTGLGRPV